MDFREVDNCLDIWEKEELSRMTIDLNMDVDGAAEFYFSIIFIVNISYSTYCVLASIQPEAAAATRRVDN